MTKKEIEKKLRDNWIFTGTGQMNYENSKRIIMDDLLTMIDPLDYERRIKIITEYLRI
jgi:hypothetical protein